jgi:hypothetical protein
VAARRGFALKQEKIGSRADSGKAQQQNRVESGAAQNVFRSFIHADPPFEIGIDSSIVKRREFYTAADFFVFDIPTGLCYTAHEFGR